tara:strand:- start:487 stop:630 length:144 start_codon:yes stop_codon:yes gene_type:complete
MIEIDRYDSASYGAFGVSFDSLTPQQQEVIIDYCTDNSVNQKTHINK